jgi:hypothetical protein
MVIAGVADAIPDRIGHLIALDAVFPRSGEALMDVVGDAEAAGLQGLADEKGDGWRLPANIFCANDFGVTDPADAAWLNRRLTDESLNRWKEPIELGTGLERVARKTYIRTELSPYSFCDRLVTEFAADPSWRTGRWDVGHDVMVIDPDRVLGAILN